MTIAATDVIPQQDQQPKIIEISDDDSLFDDKPFDNEMTSLIKPYSYDDGVARLGYDPIKELEDVFPLKKPTALPPLRAINPKIDIIDDEAYKVLQLQRNGTLRQQMSKSKEVSYISSTTSEIQANIP